MHVDVWSHTEPQDWGMQALGGGTLTIVDGHAGIASGDEVEVVRWPHGTWWDAETDELVSAEGHRFAPGDRMSLGGGYVDNDRTGPSSTRGADTVFDMGFNTIRPAG